MNPVDVPPEFLSVAEQLSQAHHSQKEVYITLIKHAYQAAFGTKYSLPCMQKALQVQAPTEREGVHFAQGEVVTKIP